MKRLRKRDWQVIYEALQFRLADDIEDTDHTPDDYAEAAVKVAERLS